MSHHTQWLYTVNEQGGVCELFNGERLLGNLRNTAACGIFTVAGTDCEWPDGTLPFALDPCSVDGNGDQTWAPLYFGGGVTDITNPAPWYDGTPGSPSSKAYGFWIEEWTGLDSSHITRSVTNRAGRRGGSNFGALSAAARTWKMNVVLVGENSSALEDLFRWLEDQLLDCCTGCGGQEMLIRTSCPPEDNPGYDLYRVQGVALTEGLRWEAPPIEQLGCLLRRVSFTISVQDPCLYSCSENCANEETFPSIDDCVPFGLWLGCDNTCEDMEPYRICCPVPAAARGTVSPVVTVYNDSPNAGPGIRIYGMSDPLNIGCDPCTLPVCQDIQILPIPSGATVMVDSATRRVLYKSTDTGGDWIDGTPFLDPPAGSAPEFLSLACTDGWVAVEPLSLCGDTEGLRVTIDVVRRVGCC